MAHTRTRVRLVIAGGRRFARTSSRRLEARDGRARPGAGASTSAARMDHRGGETANSSRRSLPVRLPAVRRGLVRVRHARGVLRPRKPVIHLHRRRRRPRAPGGRRSCGERSSPHPPKAETSPRPWTALLRRPRAKLPPPRRRGTASGSTHCTSPGTTWSTARSREGGLVHAALGRSAIAEYSVHVCAALEQLCQVDLWVGTTAWRRLDPGHRRT